MQPRGRGKSNNLKEEPARSNAAPAPAGVGARATPTAEGTRHQSSFDQIAVGIAHTTIHGIILQVNRRLCELLGYTAAELVGKTTRNLTHPDDRDQQDQLRQELLADTRRQFSSDKRYLRKDGSVIWVSRTVALARDTPDSEPYLIQTIDGIDERKATEERYRATFENAPVGIMHTLIEGYQILRANRKLCEMLGYTQEELLRMSSENIVHPDYHHTDAQNYRRQMIEEGMKTYASERVFVRKDGTSIWVRRTISLVRDAAGMPDYFIRVIEDITERKQIEDRFRTTFDNAPIGILQTSIADNTILQVNPKASEMLGYTREELLDINLDDLAQPSVAGTDLGKYRDQMLSGEMKSYVSEREYRRKDGSTVWVNRTISLTRDSKGKPLYFIRIIEDITERILSSRRIAMEHAVTQTLAESAPLEQVMQNILQIICKALDWTCGSYWEWNAAEELLHCVETWDTGATSVKEFIETSRHNPNEAPTWHDGPPGTVSGGVVRRVWFSGTPVWFPDVLQREDFRRGKAATGAGLRSAFGFPILAGTRPLGVMEFYGREIKQPDEALQIMVHSIGSQIGQFIQRKQAEDKLAFMAQFDPITELPNRFLIVDRLAQMLTQAARNDWLVGVLFLDLDRFKVVNDTHGHAAGDKLLRQVAERTKKCVRAGDTAGRLSGDEFAVILSDLAKADDAALVAHKIVEALAAPYDLDGNQIYISASIGIALYPSDGENADTLLKNADTAMYRAKEQGRNGYQFYLPQMNERLIQRQKIDAQLRGALERNEFLLHYQPKVSLATGTITGFEALLRWQHGGRLIQPGEFIPIMEDTGLIVAVGEWVLTSVCEQLKLWEQAGITLLPVAVNLSARQFQRKNLTEMIGGVLRETCVAPALLKLELTESLLMSDAKEAVDTLHQLKALGVQLSVDDFGTGYSSLAYLKRFPLDELKIDREFIRDAVVDPDDATIAISIINLAHSLKLRVVAEGVETEGQLAFLRLHGCDEIQGYYFSRPQPVADCSRMLTEDRRLPDVQSTDNRSNAALLLVVDDEHELELLIDTFTAGYCVMTARNANDGFEILARHHHMDIVICDNDMPGMNGVEFLSRVRKMHPYILRVLTTSGDDAPTLTRATNKAAIHLFLPKRWAADRLFTEVRDALQAHVDAVSAASLQPGLTPGPE